jgi:hypothetical protein
VLLERSKINVMTVIGTRALTNVNIWSIAMSRLSDRIAADVLPAPVALLISTASL